jgi:3-oxoacyl-[acyl-carrier protein] reductase
VAITIDYKGWKFLFEKLPSSDEIEAKYEAYVGATEVALPLPTPTPLKRRTGRREGTELTDQRVALYSTEVTELTRGIASSLSAEGASVHVADPARFAGMEVDPFEPDSDARLRAVVCDLSEARRVEELDELFRFVQPRLPRMEKGARIILVGRPSGEADTPEEAAVQYAIDGFGRALAREVGVSGSTVNRLEVEPDADDRIGGPLQFLASARSAYVDGQVFRVTDEASPLGDEDTSEQGALHGKVALVTGASRGIGRATGLALAREGAAVVWVDLPEDNRFDLPGTEGALESLVNNHGGRSCLLDVSADDAPERLCAIVEELGGVDIIVNNAGIVDDAMFFTMAESAWRDVLDVNLHAPRRITAAMLDAGLVRDGGRLIYVSSVAGLAGNPGQVNYSTSKSGLFGLVEHYAPRLAPRGITVNAVAAGTTETVLLQTAPEWMRAIGARLNALSQVGQPVDTANLIAFLALPDSQGITGEWIRCCGAALQGR